MRHWLVKQEPTSYPFSALVRDGSTRWTGVHHPTAQRNLRTMRPGDLGVYYHTGSERAAVGTFRVAGDPCPDPGDARGAWCVELAADRPLPAPVAMSALRTEPTFASSPLTREPRLSVVPLTPAEWRRILALGGVPPRGRVSRS